MSLARRAGAELTGTGLLVAVVIGSGIAAAQLLGAIVAVAAIAWWFPLPAPATVAAAPTRKAVR
ncbi:hypothetical protein [Actinoplanes sp. L3-i22]|uniref:hypothetical protein n=1 Tax=Actinoplanes sp. L3-i22 TaxID=2836373 RepID=UPI001C78F26F|nr:hypothetical protein [Actinoplanes sp. L3-i22]BCY11692.1 hypothetical protein L3i22_067800 [Actinoplanes sp. L3-i22]